MGQLQQANLKAHLFFIYTDKTIASFDVFKKAMSSCLRKLQHKLDKVHEDSV
jgi:ribonuclease P protein component